MDVQLILIVSINDLDSLGMVWYGLVWFGMVW
jgi:hypothetical protein